MLIEGSLKREGGRGGWRGKEGEGNIYVVFVCVDVGSNALHG